jgi:hypothetical protein
MSGHENTGVLHGAYLEAGLHGNCVVFDGGTAYVETPNSPSLDFGGTDVTIAFWARINSNSSASDYVLVGKPWSGISMPSPFYQYGVEYSNSSYKTLDFFFGDPAAGLHGPFRMNVSPGVWTHCAFTYDGNTVKGYVNGAERLSAPDVSSLQPRGNSLRLGVDGAYQQFYNGTLDDLRIYSRALTQAEVQSTMQNPVGSGAVAVPSESTDSQEHGALALVAASPNPCQGGTTLSFTMAEAAQAELRVFDITGRLVRTLMRAPLASGPHSVDWNGRDSHGRPVASGRYLLRLRVGREKRLASVLVVQ